VSKAKATPRERTYKKKGQPPADADDGAKSATVHLVDAATRTVHLVDPATGTVLATGRLEATASGVKGAAASITLSGSAAGTSTVSGDLTVGASTALTFIPDELPAALFQQTFAEAKAAGIAFADGPKQRRWNVVEGEISLWHQADKSSFQTKLTGGPLLDWLGLPNTVASLREELQRAGLPAVLLLHVVIAGSLERAEKNRLYVTVQTDDLIKAIGWEPRSTLERERMRQRVWRWMAMFDAARVIGKRPGTYLDPITKKVIDLTSIAALIRIMDEGKPTQLAFDNSAPPLEITYAAGPWIEQWRGNRQILTYFAVDIRRLAGIAAGKPSGAWAQSIGLALHQKWRERSARAEVRHVGENKSLTVDFGSFTRRALLDLFPPDPSLDDVLRGPNPQRAREHWEDAIGILKRDAIISYYRARDTLPEKRQGWQRAWLEQKIDIRPTDEGKEAAAEIATRAQVIRRARTKRKAARTVVQLASGKPE